jgi:hypothetical protein
MVVAPVPTTAIVIATSGALKRKRSMTIRRLLTERAINAFIQVFEQNNDY